MVSISKRAIFGEDRLMGWAARCRTGLADRTRQSWRRRQLAHNLMPRLILHQLLHLVVAIILMPWRVCLVLGRLLLRTRLLLRSRHHAESSH